MKPVQRVDVFRVPCSGPGDLRGVQALIDAGALVPADIVAVMGKTESNGCVNDHTRDFAATSWCHFLSPHLDCPPAVVAQRVALVMSGGTEGVLSPHFTVFTRRWLPAADGGAMLPKRLVVGIAHTRDFLPEEMGRAAQIEATREATLAAMRDAGISDAADVHFVQVKCPLLTAGKTAAALARGIAPVTQDSYESMGYSRGASALGVALALGEVQPADISDACVMSDWRLYSARASASAGLKVFSMGIAVILRWFHSLLAGLGRQEKAIGHGKAPLFQRWLAGSGAGAVWRGRCGAGSGGGCIDRCHRRVVRALAVRPAGDQGPGRARIGAWGVVASRRHRLVDAARPGRRGLCGAGDGADRGDRGADVAGLVAFSVRLGDKRVAVAGRNPA